jgi:hypothetical protein
MFIRFPQNRSASPGFLATSILRLGFTALVLQACAEDAPNPSGPGDETDGQVDDEPGLRADAGPGKKPMDAGRAGPLDAGPSRAPDASVSANDAGATSSPAPDATTGPVDNAAFSMCTQALKKACGQYEKETGCSSFRSNTTPLTAGGTGGGVEISGGPYGAFIAYNQGVGFENPVALAEAGCTVIAGTFGEPASVTQDVLDLRGADLALYTVFRPACMRDGETYPVITWGNGTCGQTGGYAPLLATMASHGFVVVASNSRFTDGGNDEMLHALDYAKAANEDAKSVLYKRLDLTKVGAMGHSQGSSATAHAATDPRIKALILWNGGASGSPAKPFLAVSGDRDIGNPTVASYSSYVNAATQPGAWVFMHKVLETGGNFTGHLTLMQQPERVTDFTVAWWKYILSGDSAAKQTFVGTDCTLCKDKTELEYGQHNLK